MIMPILVDRLQLTATKADAKLPPGCTTRTDLSGGMASSARAWLQAGSAQSHAIEAIQGQLRHRPGCTGCPCTAPGPGSSKAHPAHCTSTAACAAPAGPPAASPSALVTAETCLSCHRAGKEPVQVQVGRVGWQHMWGAYNNVRGRPREGVSRWRGGRHSNYLGRAEQCWLPVGLCVAHRLPQRWWGRSAVNVMLTIVAEG